MGFKGEMSNFRDAPLKWKAFALLTYKSVKVGQWQVQDESFNEMESVGWDAEKTLLPAWVTVRLFGDPVRTSEQAAQLIWLTATTLHSSPRGSWENARGAATNAAWAASPGGASWSWQWLEIKSEACNGFRFATHLDPANRRWSGPATPREVSVTCAAGGMPIVHMSHGSSPLPRRYAHIPGAATAAAMVAVQQVN